MEEEERFSKTLLGGESEDASYDPRIYSVRNSQLIWENRNRLYHTLVVSHPEYFLPLIVFKNLIA